MSAACVNIHTVSLCLGSVQFMCLEIWLPTLLAVQLVVFYVFTSAGWIFALERLFEICVQRLQWYISGLYSLLWLSLFVFWVVCLAHAL